MKISEVAKEIFKRRHAPNSMRVDPSAFALFDALALAFDEWQASVEERLLRGPVQHETVRAILGRIEYLRARVDGEPPNSRHPTSVTLTAPFHQPASVTAIPLDTFEVFRIEDPGPSRYDAEPEDVPE